MRDSLQQTPNADAGIQMVGPPRTGLKVAQQHQSAWLKRQTAVVEIGRRAVAPPEVSVLMQDAASLIADLLEVEHYAVADTSTDGSTLRVVLNIRQADVERFKTFSRKCAAAARDSLVGCALESTQPLAVSELANERRFRDTFLLEHGIQSAIAVPLALREQSFGALVACSERVLCFKSEDLLFSETVAHLITNTIARRKAEKALAEERRLYGQVWEAAGALVLVLDAKGRIARVNQSCEQLTGFSLSEIKGRPVWDVFLLPGEVEMFRLIFHALAEGGLPVACESSLLTKHSDQWRIAWSCAVMPAADGSTECIVATGIDVTERRRTEKNVPDPGTNDQAPPEPGAVQAAANSETHPREPASGDRNSAPGTAADALFTERRGRPRRAYPYRPLIAPIIDGKLPSRDDFADVRCNDIAAGGFSFRTSTPPASNCFVVALGHPPNLTYIAAEIVHVTRIKCEGQPTYRVGCTYTGRANY